ncbi:MAG: hypothetical protein ACRDZ4_10870 [Egibacteraceae bacterium]
MSAINDIINLADKLRECRDLADRSASLEQACRESEARLRSLRAAEFVVKNELDAAEESATLLVEAAERDVEQRRKSADAAAAEKLADCDIACTAREMEAETWLAKIEAQGKQKLDAAHALEDEETRLAQSVTALKAELAALRARLG